MCVSATENSGSCESTNQVRGSCLFLTEGAALGGACWRVCKEEGNMLDMTRFYPEVYQAVAGEDYTVYVYMNDGSMRLYDAKPLIDKGGHLPAFGG